jgi:hypothetical protein
MWKIDVQRGGQWVERNTDRRFFREVVSGQSRLKLVLPRSHRTLVRDLVTKLPAPFQLLYVLHTSRGEGPLGRYQSPEIDRTELNDFLTRFANFLAGDARHDLWLRSAAANALIVWDRHNDIYLYGDLGPFAEWLADLGLQEGEIERLGQHVHHYRAEFDADARAVLDAFGWRRSALRAEDEQHDPPAADDG